MSACTRWLDRLLEADPDELRGVAESALARHIRACDLCREAAQRILDATARLDLALSRPAPVSELDLDALVDRSRITRSAHGVPLLGRSRWRWAGLAAAASAVGLLLLREHRPSLPGVELQPSTPIPPMVEVPAGRNLAVIETDNPDITVIWFF